MKSLPACPLRLLHSWIVLGLIVAPIAPATSGCGEDSGPAEEDGPRVAEVPPVPEQSGVAYVVNYDASQLFMYRTDGDAPAAAGSIDLGGSTHDLVLDPYNDLLIAVSHVTESVSLYALDRPGSPQDELAAPELLSTLNMQLLPMFAEVNPIRHRLYVVAAIDDGEAQTEFSLFAYDISDPREPRELSGSPMSIPATAALTLDPAREALFVVGLLTDELYVFDLHDDVLTALPGSPLDLAALYPQQHQSPLQVIGLQVDPHRHRLYAARSQSVLSELIIIEYPEALPTSERGYASLVSYEDLVPLEDPFDVDEDIENRTTIYDAHLPALDLERGHVFLSAGGWEAMYVYGVIVPITSELALGTGCPEGYAGVGCWLQRYSNGAPIEKGPTGGATCVDYTHRIVVGTSVFAAGHDSAVEGFVNTFRYDDELALTPWLPEGGGNLAAGSRPIRAVCH